MFDRIEREFKATLDQHELSVAEPRTLNGASNVVAQVVLDPGGDHAFLLVGGKTRPGELFAFEDVAAYRNWIGRRRLVDLARESAAYAINDDGGRSDPPSPVLTFSEALEMARGHLDGLNAMFAADCVATTGDSLDAWKAQFLADVGVGEVRRQDFLAAQALP